MKNTIAKLLFFVFIVFVADKVIGVFCKRLYYKTNDYTIHRLRYTLDSTREDVLILGSSRAQYHFVPPIIYQNTGLSSYNCGFGGQGLLFSLIQLNESLKRYKPKLVVLEVSPNVLIDPEWHEKLKILMPFSKKDSMIYAALTKNQALEKVKLLSSIYPYNSTIASLVSGGFKPNVDSLNGFEPLQGSIDTTKLGNWLNTTFSSSCIPADRMSGLKEFIAYCDNNGLKVVVVLSPVYQANANYEEMTKQIELSCRGYKNTAFMDFTRLASVYHNRAYFYDDLHLNYQGAKIFSDTFSKRLKAIIENKTM